MKNKYPSPPLRTGKKILLNIMRLFIFLFFTSAFCLTPSRGLSQNETIQLPKHTSLTVDEVFDLVKSQTTHKFIYRSDLFKGAPKVSFNQSKITLKKLLTKSLSGSGFNFRFGKDGNVIISKVPQQQKQQIEIHGVVTDENGIPLPGANISVNDGEHGTTTDFDGKYTVNVSVGDKIVFSFLGFEAQTFEIKDDTSTEINVSLKESQTSLDAVTISTGFQTISKERSTGSYGTLGKAQIDKPASNIAERLVGAVSGLQTTTNPDGTIDLQIRGQSSLFADQEPLIVVDGFPVENGLATVNPQDVESVTVLKDAAAASIWGAKAGNGVIVVTTKRGKEGTTHVSLSSYIKMSNKLDLGYVLNRAPASDVLEYEQKAFDTDLFGTLFGPPPSNSINEVQAPYSQAIVAMNEARLGRITPEERDATLNRLSQLNNMGQIKKYLLRAPVTKHYNLSIDGGNEKMTNRLSLMFEDKNTFFRGDQSENYMLNFNNKTALTSFLDFNFEAMLQYRKDQNNSGGNMLGTIRNLAPWDMLVDENGNPNDMSYLNFYMPNFNAYVPVNDFPYSDWSYNPITEVDENDLQTKHLNARVQGGLTLKIMDGLNLSSKIQYQRFSTKTNNYYNEKTYHTRSFVNMNSGPEWLNGDVPSQLIPTGGLLNQSKTNVTSYSFRNQIDFTRVFAEDHRIDFVGGTEISNRVTKVNIPPTVYGYDKETNASSPLLKDPTGAHDWQGYSVGTANTYYRFSFSENTTRFFSLYGNLNYTYKNKYSISGSYRTDAANIIADKAKYRYDPFWSVGGRWQVAKEDFTENLDWLDQLDLRVTYGVNGNIDRSTSFMPLISLSSSLDPYTLQNTASIASFGNPTLRWEKTKSLNFGLDFRVLNSALRGSFNIYGKKGTDLIVDETISAVNGTTQQKFNNGVLMNKGFELELGTNSIPVLGNDITWSSSFNFSYNKNTIKRFFKAHYESYDLYQGPTTSYVQGHDANAIWAYQYAGLTNVGSEANPVMKPSVVGEDGQKYTLLSFAPGEATKYMKDQGTSVAPYYLGFTNSFKIYDFDLSAIFTAKFGHKFRRQSFNYPSMTGGNSSLNNHYSEVANGDPEKILPIPDVEPRYYFYDRFYPYMDYLTANASFIRFQEVNLTYNLPQRIIGNWGIDALKLYVQANNLGVVKFNHFGEDPEFPKGTIRPRPTYTLGFQLNF